MKKLIGLVAFSLLSLNSFAGEIGFTTAEFRVVKVALTCPQPAPGHMSCMATGGKITVQATIDCLDTLLFSHFEMATNTTVPTLRAVSVVRTDSDSMRVMCTRMNTITKTISVATITDEHVEIINEEIR